MVESIYIKNFGPLKEIKIDEIKPFTILIGESASGKSTIMKVLALFRWIYKMQNIRSYLKHSNISKSPFRFQMKTLITNCGFKEYFKSETEIIYKTTFDSGNTYSLSYSNGKLSGTTDKNLIFKEDISFNKISFISELRNAIPHIIKSNSKSKGENLGFYFTEILNDFNSATENFEFHDLNFLGIRFYKTTTTFGDKFRIKSISNNNFDIEFSDSSSGIQNSIPIAVVSRYFSTWFNFKNAFDRSVLRYLNEADSLTDFKPIKNLSDILQNIYIHVEEPELGLYPEAQCELINMLVWHCRRQGHNQIEYILSTHSPYIINHLNRLIKAYDTNASEPNINFEHLAVYLVGDGKLFDLKLNLDRLINTDPLSETMNEIYNDYEAMQ